MFVQCLNSLMVVLKLVMFKNERHEKKPTKIEDKCKMDISNYRNLIITETEYGMHNINCTKSACEHMCQKFQYDEQLIGRFATWLESPGCRASRPSQIYILSVIPNKIFRREYSYLVCLVLSAFLPFIFVHIAISRRRRIAYTILLTRVQTFLDVSLEFEEIKQILKWTYFHFILLRELV